MRLFILPLLVLVAVAEATFPRPSICIANSFWNNNQCSCNRGLVGVGDLCCSNPREYGFHCETVGNSYWTKSLSNHAQLFNPCGMEMARFNAKTLKGENCIVSARTADILKNGRFLSNELVLTFKIGCNRQNYIYLNGKQYYHCKRATGYGQIKWQNFACSKKKVLTLSGETITITLDAFHNVMTVHGCGTLFTFRKDPVKGGASGLSIESKFSHAASHSVCTLLKSKGNGVYSSKAEYVLAASLKYNSYRQHKLNCYRGQCKALTLAFKSCSAARFPGAMKACGGILEESFRFCAYNNGIDGAHLFNLFTRCIKGYVQGNRQWCCQASKIDTFKKCPSGLRCQGVRIRTTHTRITTIHKIRHKVRIVHAIH